LGIYLGGGKGGEGGLKEKRDARGGSENTGNAREKGRNEKGHRSFDEFVFILFLLKNREKVGKWGARHSSGGNKKDANLKGDAQTTKKDFSSCQQHYPPQWEEGGPSRGRRQKYTLGGELARDP